MDGKNGFLWRESISAVAETGGFFRVEIKAYATADTVGSYTIKLLKPRLSAAQDRQHIEAERRLAAGRKLYEQDGAHYEEAIGEFETLVKLWRDLKDPQYEGMALVNLGWIYYMFSNYEKTLASLNRAVELLRETKDKLGESKALNIILTTKLS